MENRPAHDNLARTLTSIRTAFEMTQEGLATRSGVSRATIYQIESCEGDPRLSTIASLASAFNITPALLLLSEADYEAIHRMVEAGIGHSGGNGRKTKLASIRQLWQSGIPRKRAEAMSQVRELAETQESSLSSTLGMAGKLALLASGITLGPIAGLVAIGLATAFGINALSKEVKSHEGE